MLSQAERLLDFLAWKTSHLLVAPGSTFSLASLLSAIAIAVLFILIRRGGKRDVSMRAMLRTIFPSWWRRSPSLKADFGLLLLNVFAATALFGWALLSADYVARTMTGALIGLFGAMPITGLSTFTSKLIATIALFLAYELAYWTDHYLSHRIPFLWEFHKVHHTAEILSPTTVFRVHPVDGIVFANFVAVFVGATGGVLNFLLGTAVTPYTVSDTNIILVVFIFLTVHLQHSHVWIPLTGIAGRVVLSPAHHQLHHSTNPAHFNRNFGFCLGVWDWMFGTLIMPSRKRECLSFGIEPRTRRQQTATGLLLEPILRALEVTLRPIIRLGRPGRAARAADSIPAE